MAGIIIAVIIGCILLTAAVVVLRACCLKPTVARDTKVELKTDERSRTYGERLAEMIRRETVSSRFDSDKTKFYEFHKVLEELFPLVHQTCEKHVFNGSLLFKWSGQGKAEPILLMSHHDVVEATGEWEQEPFGGKIDEEGRLWGRGTVDTKASLFCIFTDRPDQLYRRVFEWNRLLGASGITVRILKFCKRNSSFLIYVYRPKLLWDVLSRTEILDFLFGMGYETVSNPDRLLKQLSCRLCLNQEFPHEIGAFLGYPLTDVIGFIEHKGRDFTFSGCWKSYGDPVEAQKRFSLYRKCTSVYQKMFENGTPIERLAVAA